MAGVTSFISGPPPVCLCKKLEVWSNISRMVSALGVAQRTPKECKDKWGNTKKGSKKVYSLARKEQRQTGAMGVLKSKRD
jgi:hypothetical protein